MESNDTLLTFPCQFPVKAMGISDGNFDSLVVSLVRKHAPDLSEGAVQTRLSNGGRYMAVTVTIQAHSKAQLDSIYQDLTAESRILVAL